MKPRQRRLISIGKWYQPQFSTDLTSWSASGVLVTSTPNADGTVTETWRAPTPMSDGITQFVRLRVL